MRTAPTLDGLVRACHPLPTAAVTAFATALAAVAGQPAATVGVVAAAVLTGQLSIGWSNDALDAGLDRAAGRTEKPTVDGSVSPRVLAKAAVVAAVLCVVASLAVGLLAGTAHLVGVAAGWAYNLRLKRTVLSPLPYVAAFGLLVVFVHLADPLHRPPGADVVAAAALLGAGAHFANVAPDIPADLAAGVRGLPQRLGATRSVRTTSVLVALAALVLALGASRPGPAGLVLLGLGAVVAVAANRAPVSAAFRLTLGAVALVVGGFLLP